MSFLLKSQITGSGGTNSIRGQTVSFQNPPPAGDLKSDYFTKKLGFLMRLGRNIHLFKCSTPSALGGVGLEASSEHLTGKKLVLYIKTGDLENDYYLQSIVIIL